MMKFLSILLALFTCSFSAHAAEAPAIAAEAYVLYDYASGQVLAEKNAHAHYAPDALTKLMTTYVVFGAIKQGKLKLDQELTPSPYAVRRQAQETRMFLTTGKNVTVDDLLRGLVIQSSNDAARVLAEALANHEMALADTMNKEAQRLGLSDTHFINATGLPDAQHYSSAHDLALLAAALIRDFPEYYYLYSQRQFQYNGINQFNRNRLLWLDPFVDGLAISQNGNSDFHLVASATRDNRRVITVIIGSKTEKVRNSDAQQLLNHAYQNFETFKLYEQTQPVASKRVWKGTVKRLNIGFADDCYITIPKGTRNQLMATLETNQPMLAPINRGDSLGTLHLLLDGRPYLNLPVYAQDDIKLANVFSRGVDNIRLLFR